MTASCEMINFSGQENELQRIAEGKELIFPDPTQPLHRVLSASGICSLLPFPFSCWGACLFSLITKVPYQYRSLKLETSLAENDIGLSVLVQQTCASIRNNLI